LDKFANCGNTPDCDAGFQTIANLKTEVKQDLETGAANCRKTRFCGPGEPMSEIRERTIQGLQVGDTFTISRRFSEADMAAFADITHDYNAVHFDSRFAAAKQFHGRICHGLLVGSLLTEVGGQIGWLASVMNFKFRKPVYFAEEITCKLTITRIDDRLRASARALYYNQNDELVLEADLEGILPDKPARRILQAMVDEGDPTNKLK
jgi:acyl dehydratase